MWLVLEMTKNLPKDIHKVEKKQKEKYVYKPIPCRYNDAVLCTKPVRNNCVECGWNPKVNKERLKKIRAERKVTRKLNTWKFLEED